MTYIAPYELPMWAQMDVPSEYYDKPSQWSEGMSPLLQEPGMTEAIFSSLRSNYPYLHNLIVDKGIEIGLPSQERLMRMYEQTGSVPTIFPGGQDSTVENTMGGVFDPRMSQILLTLDPNYRNIALHELGHAAIEHTSEWQKTLNKMPLTSKQESILDLLGYPIESKINAYGKDYGKALNFTFPDWPRAAKEETMLRYLFPVLQTDADFLEKDQEYIANRLMDYFKYGPQNK